MSFFEAQAALCGTARYPNLRGSAHFFQKDCGTVVQVSLSGLPRGCGSVGFHGLYIEEGCGAPPLRVRGGGILPPVLNAGGLAMATFFTTGFRPEELCGRKLVLTANADCFERAASTPIASGAIVPGSPSAAPWPPAPCCEPPRRPPWEECPPPRPDCCRPAPPCPPLFPPPRRC